MPDESHVQLPPERIGSYQRVGESPLGTGGMGVVWLYRETGISSREVAIKFIRIDENIELNKANLIKDIKALEALPIHQNIITMYTVIEEQGNIALVMEYVPGGMTLRGAIHEHPHGMPIPLAKEILAGILSGVSHAHDYGVIHRDIKPDNILMRQPRANSVLGRNNVKIVDFGISKVRRGDTRRFTTAVAFTEAYAAPEQINAEETGGFTDVYAIGVVLYEMIAGRKPFDGKIAEIITGHCFKAPPPITRGDIPDGLRAMLDKALQKDPSDRYQDAIEMQMEYYALDRMGELGPMGGRPETTKPREGGAQSATGPQTDNSGNWDTGGAGQGQGQEDDDNTIISGQKKKRPLAESRKPEDVTERHDSSQRDDEWHSGSGEEEARRREESKRRAEEKARWEAAEEARLKEEEEARRREESKRRAEEKARWEAAEAARLKEEEDARRREESKRRAEEKARWEAAEAARLREEEEARLREEEEARRREESKRRAEEKARWEAAEKARLREEEEARQRAQAEAERKAEEEAKKKAKEEAKRLAKEETRRQAAEEARRKEEAKARRKAEAEALRIAQATERATSYVDAQLPQDSDRPEYGPGFSVGSRQIKISGLLTRKNIIIAAAAALLVALPIVIVKSASGKQKGNAKEPAKEDSGSEYDLSSLLASSAPDFSRVSKIELNKKILDLEVGQSETLRSTISPIQATDKKVYWSSSDKRVATVLNGPSANGLVRAVGDGNAVITAKSSDGGFIAFCDVRVSAIPNSGIQLDKRSEVLVVGKAGQDTLTLTATINPPQAANKKLQWSSSNPAVAAVTERGANAHEGFVRAIGSGSTVITVKSSDGTLQQTSCNITVKVPVTGIVLKPSPQTLRVAQTDLLTPTIQPSGASNKNVSWRSDNPSVASVDINTGLVRAISRGSAVITATAMDDSNVSAQVRYTIEPSEAQLRAEQEERDRQRAAAEAEENRRRAAEAAAPPANAPPPTTAPATTVPIVVGSRVDRAKETVNRLAGNFAVTGSGNNMTWRHKDVSSFVSGREGAVANRREPESGTLDVRIVRGNALEMTASHIFGASGSKHPYRQVQVSYAAGGSRVATASGLSPATKSDFNRGLTSESVSLSQDFLSRIATASVQGRDMAIEFHGDTDKAFALPNSVQKAIQETLELHEALAILMAENVPIQKSY